MKKETLETAIAICPYCEQSISITKKSDCDYLESEYAARACSCPGARGYQSELIAKARRAEVLEDTKDTLYDLFSNAATETLELLVLISTLVYDRVIKEATASVNNTTKAKICRTSKGNISIERKESASEKTEIITI